MRQRHSYHRLYYHLVFNTKQRQPIITSESAHDELSGYFILKAIALDAFVEEFGSWHDHVHLLLRCSPVVALSSIYGQLKGFSARAWNLKHPDRILGWADGVFISSVDPEDNLELRRYIRNQRIHHEQKNLLPPWEPDEQD